jgi:sugar/nucleoside kinase (ribokinase family)
MYDLISVGTISVDLYFKGESFTFKDNRFALAVGGKYVANKFDLKIGGGGANVAIGVAHHGFKTAVIGKIGNNPFKKIILDYLKNRHVSTNLIDQEDNYYNLSAILLTQKGERTIIHYASPHQHLFSADNPLSGLIKTKVIYLGNLPDVSLTKRIKFLKFIGKYKIIRILNLGVIDCRRPKPQLKEILNEIDILIVNGYEFSEMVKAPHQDIHFHEDVISWYIPSLFEKIVIITEGERGSFGYYRGKVFYQRALKLAQIVDTTGAGDAYTAGFISEFLKSYDIEKSMKKGAIYASHILAKIGAN